MILTATLLSVAIAAETPTPDATLKEALTEGKIAAEVRLRYERVTEDNLPPAIVNTTADALTVRLALGYTTKVWHGLSASAQYEGVFALGDNYNAYPGAPSEYPVVADPEDTGLNQAWLRYQRGGDDWSMKTTLGRQELNLLNQRWLGAVAWRQHHQSFDAAALSAKLPGGFVLDYDYLRGVHRIVGDHAPAAGFGNDGEADLEGHAFAIGWKAEKQIAISGYGLLVDMDKPYVGISSRTLGVRVEGPWSLSETVAIPFALDLAKQSDYGGRTTDFTGDYLAAEGGVSWKGISAKLLYEKLGSDDGTAAVQSPFATLHAFNGWADVFLSTPVKGLVTKGLVVDGPIPGLPRVAGTVAAYRFTSDVDSVDYGRELDLQLTWKPLASEKTLLIGGKVAWFNGDEAFTGTRAYAAETDVSKYMVWTQYAF
jgi:hypothetical protein